MLAVLAYKVVWKKTLMPLNFLLSMFLAQMCKGKQRERQNLEKNQKIRIEPYQEV